MHDLAADLPAPRDDEPADLRRDILDELSDHLQCAVDRERQRAALEGEDVASLPESNLWQRAVTRFGEPAKIVRQLWWDAMKERIMSQRTQTASLVIMTVLVLGMFVLTWMSLADSRRLAQDNQQLNRDLLAQMQLLADRPQPAPVVQPTAIESPAEWNELQFRCVWGDETGEPVEGVRIYLESDSDNTSGIPPGEETSGADGIVDFGKVLYGTYTFTVRTPNRLIYRRQVAIRPGQDKSVTVVCPDGDGTQTVTLEPGFDWNVIPESFREQTWLYYVVSGDGMALGQGSGLWDTDYEYEWPESSLDGSAIGESFGYSPGIELYLINSSGQILPAGELLVEESQVDADWVAGSHLARVASQLIELPEQPTYVDSIQLPVGGYNVYARMAVVDPDDPTGRRVLLIQDLPLGGGGGFGGDPYGSAMGGPYGEEAMASMMGGGGRRGRGQQQGRAGDREFSVPLGRLPLSYLISNYGNDAVAMMSAGAGDYGAGGYGGPMGSSSNMYTVDWDKPATWEVIVPETGSMALAELALRVPVGMNVAPVNARFILGADDAPQAGSAVDLVWKGLLVDDEGNVHLEEHVLLTGVDLMAFSGPSGEVGEEMYQEFYVPITAEEAAVFLDESIALGLWVRASTEQVRDTATTMMDAELIERLKSTSVLYPVSNQNELPMGMQIITIDARGSLTGSSGPDFLERGSLCHVSLRRPTETETTHTLLRLLDNRLVHGVHRVSDNLAEYQVDILVTADESSLITDAQRIDEVTAGYIYEPTSINPLRETPNLEEVRRELSNIERRTMLPPGTGISIVGANISAEDVDSLQLDDVVDLVWSGLLMNADGHVISEEHILIAGLNLVEIREPIDQGQFSFVRLGMPVTADEVAALDSLRNRDLFVRPSTLLARTSADESIDGALLERLQQDTAKYVSRRFMENDYEMQRFVAESKPVTVAAPASAFDGSAIDELSVGMLCNLYLQIPQGPESTNVSSDRQHRLLLSNRMVVKNVETNANGLRESVVFIHDIEVELFELAQRVGEVVALPAYVASEIDPDMPNPGLEEAVTTLKVLLPEDDDPEADALPVE